MGRSSEGVRVVLLVVAASACGAAMPESEPHEILGAPIETVNALRVEPAPPEETCAVPQPGRVTVVEFWATWCAPCAESLVALEALWGRVDRRRVAFVGAAIDEDATSVRAIVPSLGVTFPMIYDSAGVLDEAFRVGRRVPSTFLVDAEGRVRFFVGGASGAAQRRVQMERLERAIAALVAESR